MCTKRYILVPLLLFTFCSQGQNAFYSNDSIREIRIYFSQTNWDHILDSLYVDGLEERLLCSLAIDGVGYDSVGIRYKGFSSVSVDRKKNPWNIKLDYLIPDQNHRGFDKIKLSNVIHDPSFVREVLSYEIARKYMPASKANFANVYVNDTLFGLYTNVEAVNKPFIFSHFGNNDNTFFKANPDNLDLNGENCNLGNSPGTDSSDYYTLYDLKSDHGCGDLYNLIDVLNTGTANISNILNIDRALWMHAFNYALINFDSYVGYAQNYYLYQDHNGQFNTVLWDLNMSFGSFRLADASEFWDGFTIAEAKTMDPLLHLNSVSVYPRPLMRNLFSNSTFKRMYLAHMRTIIEENIDNQLLVTRGTALQSLIDQSVQNDTNKFYSYSDFLANLDSTVTDLIDYPGLTELMDARSAYLATYVGIPGSPAISNVSVSAASPSVGDDLSITATISNANEAMLAYRYSSADVFQYTSMADDGNHGDGSASDGVYGATLTEIGNHIEYYVYAQNSSAGRFSPQRAAYEFYTLDFQMGSMDLAINEFMASNSTIVADNNGEYDDWIELHNNTNSTLSTNGLYLSDKRDTLFKWQMPDVSIPPNGYQIVWADKDLTQDGLHADFRLTSNGEDIVLVYGNGTIVDSTSYGSLATDVSLSRYPNGTGDFTILATTFNSDNTPAGLNDFTPSIPFSVFPSIADEEITIEWEGALNATVVLSNLYGQILSGEVVQNQSMYSLSVSHLPGGIYFVTLNQGSNFATRKVIIQ